MKRTKGILVGISFLFVVVVFVFFLINNFLFAGALPFNRDPKNLARYANIKSVSNLDNLLRAERIFAGGGLGQVWVSNMEITPKAFHGDVVYVYEQSEIYKDKDKRPMEYVSFSKVFVDGRVGYVVGEKVKNKDGSISFLHFGYLGRRSADIDTFKNEIGRIQKNTYMVPMAKVEKCERIFLHTEFCRTVDQQKVSKLVLEWVETGNIPDELQNIILIPYIQAWY